MKRLSPQLMVMIMTACGSPVGQNGSYLGQPSAGGNGGAQSDDADSAGDEAGIHAGGSSVNAENAKAAAGAHPTPEHNQVLLADLPKGDQQLKVLCQRGGQDKVREVFCNGKPPAVNSLRDLQKALGLGIEKSSGIVGSVLGTGVGFAFTAASSSLVAQSTSSINPRLVMFTQGANNRLVGMGFVRGEQFAEIVAKDPQSGTLKFFLAAFTQACNDRPGGCNYADMLTPAIEKNWNGLTIYEDEDIKNTIVDCRQCHQPGGPSSPKMLRMQERINPWLHWMRSSTAGGIQLINDFQAVHGTSEEFAGVPGNVISQSDPRNLETFVEGNGFASQPNEFSSATILLQQTLGQSGNGDRAPAAWQSLYDGFAKGEFIAPPYHNLRVSDPGKLKNMAAKYQSFAAGTLPPEKFPDIRDVLDDSGLRDMGFMVKEGLTPEQIIVQACSQCHNDRLDQTVSRAKFSVNLSRMDCKEKQVAIDRLRLGKDEIKRMPPPRFRNLTDGEINKVADFLKCK